MHVFLHHIYEYKKGLRRMILHTSPASRQGEIEHKLTSLHIAYHIMTVTHDKINVFFGDTDCVNVIRSFNIKSLSHLSCEQDFILGALLGYDLCLQSRRYLKRRCALPTGVASPENTQILQFRKETAYVG